MSKINCHYVVSCSGKCCKTEMNCVLDVVENTYELKYYSDIGKNKYHIYDETILGKIIYVDYVKNPFTVHAYLEYKLNPNSEYSDIILEITSFPGLQHNFLDKLLREKYVIGDTPFHKIPYPDENTNINGKITVNTISNIPRSRVIDVFGEINNMMLTIF